MSGESTGCHGSCGVLVTTLEFVPSSWGPLQIEYDETRASLCKGTIDGVDAALSGLFGLTDAEADHIMNYSVKYRVGPDAA